MRPLALLAMGLTLLRPLAAQAQEEPARGHFTDGLALLAAGDSGRALSALRVAIEADSRFAQAHYYECDWIPLS